MRTEIILLSISFLICSVLSTSVYQFQGDPYQGGFNVEKEVSSFFLWQYEGVKYHSVVYYPKVPGTYSALYFIGGLGGIIPAEFYTDLLKSIASHGYIVIGVDHIFGGVFPPSAEEVLSWLQVNLQKYLTESAPGVKVAWDHLGLGGHSGGSESVLEMVIKNPKIANGTLFLEGGWTENYLLSEALSHANFSHPGLIYATEYATRKSFILPQCGEQGQAEALYHDWNCPRIVMNVTGFGHCDILDPIGWEGCWLTDFCYTDPGNDRVTYRKFTQGLFSAFLGYYVQGNKDMLPYFTDSSKFLGLKMLDFQADVTCSNTKPKQKKEKKVHKNELSILKHKSKAQQSFFQTKVNNKQSKDKITLN